MKKQYITPATTTLAIQSHFVIAASKPGVQGSTSGDGDSGFSQGVRHQWLNSDRQGTWDEPQAEANMW